MLSSWSVFDVDCLFLVSVGGCDAWIVGNAVSLVKSISFGILRWWVLHDRLVVFVSRLTSSPIDVATEAFGDLSV